MDRIADYPRRLARSIDKPIEALAILAIVVIHLQLIGASLVTPLTGYHHHHHQGFPSQVRWTKPPIHRSHHGRPVDIMTDVINDLGVKILDRYVDNGGNVGFSPSGLGFVLVALYEGSAGSSNRQIGDVLGLPNDRRITRIGLRDIHRRLRSYLNADAFLGGLTLNRDDINLRPEYEDILRFYGFDISDSGSDGNATTPLPGVATDGLTDSASTTDATSPAANTLVVSTDSPSTADATSPAGSTLVVSTDSSSAPDASTPAANTLVASTDPSTSQTTTAATSPMPTTINDAVDIITDTTGGTNSALSMSSTAGSPATNATPTTLNAMSQMVAATNSTTANSGILNSLSPTTASMTTTSGIGMTTPTSTTPMISSTVPGSPNSNAPTSTIVPMQRLVGPPTDSDMQSQSSTRLVATTPVENPTSPVSIASTAITGTDRGDAMSTDLPGTTPMQRTAGSLTVSAEMETEGSGSATITPAISSTDLPMIIPATLSMSMDNSNATTAGSSTSTQTENSTRNANEDATTNSVRKRRGIPQGPAGYFSSSADDGIWLDEFGRLSAHDDYPSQDEDIVADSKRPTEVAFLVNGCDYSRVTAAAYTAVLPFAYFPSLRASLLEFPLDDPRYKILVMLPSESNGTRRLARLLATEGITLRQLRRSLRPNWITAVIPSFMLRGFVTLTPFLQRLGISDVFEPRAADLSPMSPDLGVYARDIQQSIGVNIRNNARGGIGGADGGNQDQQRSRSAALVRNARGVVGLPPFFVADRAISPPTRGDSHYSPYPRAGNVLYEKAHPLPFVADRPFLYFIIDDETSVTLLAGRIDDPLNSRML